MTDRATRDFVFYSGETLQLEEGGSLNLTRYADRETGGIRTAITVPPESTVPVPTLTDRDIGVLCGRLLAFSFSPEAEPVPVAEVLHGENVEADA